MAGLGNKSHHKNILLLSIKIINNSGLILASSGGAVSI
jgi:hypothetical protein